MLRLTLARVRGWPNCRVQTCALPVFVFTDDDLFLKLAARGNWSAGKSKGRFPKDRFRPSKVSALTPRPLNLFTTQRRRTRLFVEPPAASRSIGTRAAASEPAVP